MSPIRRRRRSAPGAQPGGIALEHATGDLHVRLIGYSTHAFEEAQADSADAIAEFVGRHSVTWVNVDGLGDGSLLGEIGELFGMHPLALEDVVNVPQRPKVEDYDEDLFVVIQMLSQQEGRPVAEQLGIYLTETAVLTFQERSGDCLEPVRQRLRSGKRRRIRESGPDYLVYALLDAVVDHYFPTLDSFQARLERLEDRLREIESDPFALIREARDDVLMLRLAINPARELMRVLSGADSPRIAAETQTFLRDCLDHLLQASEQLEGCREIAAGLMDIHLSTVSHRANETMKVLTLVATIFMPLSFIVGVYGMNFNPELPGNMPELNWPYGYVGALGIMAGAVGGMLYYFKRKGWL